MRLNKYTMLKFVEATIGRILVVVGVLLIGVGLLFTTTRGSTGFALGLFFGVLLIVVGFGIHLNLFSVDLRSMDGFGTVLISLSPLLVVAGFVLASFAELDYSNALVIPRIAHMRIMPNQYVVIVPLARIYSWLTMPFLIGGAVAFVVGVLLKVLDTI